MRQERSRSLIIELQTWLREQHARLSKNSDTTKAINYSLNRWDAFTRFLDDGRYRLESRIIGEGDGSRCVDTNSTKVVLSSDN